jgi:hypothetical protein
VEGDEQAARLAGTLADVTLFEALAGELQARRSEQPAIRGY